MVGLAGLQSHKHHLLLLVVEQLDGEVVGVARESRRFEGVENKFLG